MLHVAATFVLCLALHGLPAPRAAEPAAQGQRRQSPVTVEIQEAMQKLDFLAGRWEGTATILQGTPGNQPLTIQQSENIRLRVRETVLLIEGTGRWIGDDGQPGEVVFEALATVTYEPQSRRYTMRSFSEMGSANPSIEVGQREIKWGFEVPGRKMRYHIWIDAEGRWRETGEWSTDGGETWTKFIDMTLRRLGGGE